MWTDLRTDLWLLWADLWLLWSGFAPEEQLMLAGTLLFAVLAVPAIVIATVVQRRRFAKRRRASLASTEPEASPVRPEALTFPHSQQPVHLTFPRSELPSPAGVASLVPSVESPDFLRPGPLHGPPVPRKRARLLGRKASLPVPVDGPPEPGALVEKPDSPVRNWAWFLGQVAEARDRENRPVALCNPRGTVRNLRAVVAHNRRWARMSGTPAAGWLRTLLNPMGVYRQTFIKVLAIERNNFVRPHVATGVIEIWAPKAAVADQTQKWQGNPAAQAFKDPDAYMWVALPQGARCEDILRVDDVIDLEPDDYHMEDIVDRERRALDTQTEQGGLLKGQLDVVPEDGPNPLMELLPAGAGCLFMFGGPIMLIMALGG